MRQPDLWRLYQLMLRARLFEEAARDLWQQGLISGEAHLGLGEEGICAGVVDHLTADDSLALDHRGTPPMVMIGVGLVELLRELLGDREGLCGGLGGHMHLFSPEHRAASSGIVGAAGPTAAGFALAAQLLRPGSLAVAFFGEGAINQGMLLESFNLAAAWKLPVLFVCKDNDWAITTRSSTVTAGKVAARAEAFGMSVWQADGWQVEDVWQVARSAVSSVRKGRGPAFLLTRCAHLEGHFMGDPLLRLGRQPVEEVKQLAAPLMRSATATKGSSPAQRMSGLGSMSVTIGRSVLNDRARRRDPVGRSRKQLDRKDSKRLTELETEIRKEIEQAVQEATAT